MAAGDDGVRNRVHRSACDGVDSFDPRRVEFAGISEACGATEYRVLQDLDWRAAVRRDIFRADCDAHAARYDWSHLPGRGGAAQVVLANSRWAVAGGISSDSVG